MHVLYMVLNGNVERYVLNLRVRKIQAEEKLKLNQLISQISSDDVKN